MGATATKARVGRGVFRVRDPAIPGGRAVRLDGAILSSALLLNVLGLALPIATLHIYDKILPNESVETLTFLTLGLVIVACIEFALRSLQSAVLAPSAAFYARDLKRQALAAYLKRRDEATGGVRNPAELLEQIQSIDRYAAYFGGQARQALIDLPFALIALALIALIGGALAFAPLCILLVYLGALALMSRATTQLTRQRRSQTVKGNDFMHEAISSILTVKSLGLEGLMQRRYERLLNGATLNHERILRQTGAIQRLGGAFGGLSVVATLTGGAALAIAGEMTIGAVAACTLLAGRAVQPALRAAKAWDEVQRSKVAADDVATLFRELAPKPSPAVVKTTCASGPALSIESERRTADGAVLASAPSGARIHVDGGVASQRTLLVEGLAGLLERPDVWLDDLEPADYRRVHEGDVVYLPRDAALFRGTILENITVYGRNCSAQFALDLSLQLGLDQDVRRLPNGYDTEVGAAVSDRLPIDVRKRITLARAIAGRPRLLLFDEPASHLDVRHVAGLSAALAEAPAYQTLVYSGERNLVDGRTHVLRLTESGGLALIEAGVDAESDVR